MADDHNRQRVSQDIDSNQFKYTFQVDERASEWVCEKVCLLVCIC